MSDVLARIRVRETHGIRRFLYPLSVPLDFPSRQAELLQITLVASTGEVVPCRWQDLNEGYEWLLEFAVSLAPFGEMELALTGHGDAALIDDPLRLTMPQAGSALISEQKRLRMEIGQDAWLRQVEYDGTPHLRQTQAILRNGEPITEQDYPEQKQGDDLAAWVAVQGQYPDGCRASTRAEITACKSWVTVTHTLDQPRTGDEVTFFLPFAVTSQVLTCDFGVGGGTYGKLQRGNAGEVVWQTAFEGNVAHWSIATSGRTDYAGKSPLEAFRSQRWFHLIDSDKSLAVAITELPPFCQEMLVSLNVAGDVSVTFRLGEVREDEEAAEFGVCYHFLNDVPAIAAATNPQSILLPPTVEVLPA